MEKVKKQQKRRGSEAGPGSSWVTPHGTYIADTCMQSTWRDRDGEYEDCPVYRLTVRTPFPASISDADLNRHLAVDFAALWPGMRLFSHAEANRRLFFDDEEVISVQKISRWRAGVCDIVITMQSDFTGFPVREDYSYQPEDIEPVGSEELPPIQGEDYPIDFDYAT